MDIVAGDADFLLWGALLWSPNDTEPVDASSEANSGRGRIDEDFWMRVIGITELRTSCVPRPALPYYQKLKNASRW